MEYGNLIKRISSVTFLKDLRAYLWISTSDYVKGSETSTDSVVVTPLNVTVEIRKRLKQDFPD